MSSTKPVHLLVLVHGMWGNPDHLAEMDRIIREQRGAEPGPNGERLHTLVAQSNKESGTYDGIDWGGERVADEVSMSSLRTWTEPHRPVNICSCLKK